MDFSKRRELTQKVYAQEISFNEACEKLGISKSGFCQWIKKNKNGLDLSNNDARLTCHICKDVFINRVSLSKHLKHVHNAIINTCYRCGIKVDGNSIANLKETISCVPCYRETTKIKQRETRKRLGVDYNRNYSRKRNKEIREEVLNYYGCFCACCKENNDKFLSIDHINNDGASHRKELKGSSIYRWLRTNNYPQGFQVLCFNCNFAKGIYGHCPHKEKENGRRNVSKRKG